jgi:hypothetical protein
MVVEPIEGGLQARDLREIRVTELVAMMESNGTLASVEADDQARAVGTATEHDETRPVTVHATAASAVAAVGRVTVNARSSHPGPKGWPDEHYQKVAVHYREALLHHPRSPMKWAAETWPTSDASMRRWVKRARVLGYLRDDEQ